MKIYFSCSLTGGRGDQPLVKSLVGWLQAQKHEVLTAHLADLELAQRDAHLLPETVYRRDMEWLAEAEVVIAEVSTPSHGVGYELATAVLTATPILCLAREGVRVSKLITGNDRLEVAIYRDLAEARQFIAGFLQRL